MRKQSFLHRLAKDSQPTRPAAALGHGRRVCRNDNETALAVAYVHRLDGEAPTCAVYTVALLGQFQRPDLAGLGGRQLGIERSFQQGMPPRAPRFVLSEMMQDADMRAGLAADSVAVADESAHVLAAVLVA